MTLDSLSLLITLELLSAVTISIFLMKNSSLQYTNAYILKHNSYLFICLRFHKRSYLI